jgi:hypothetical protein
MKGRKQDAPAVRDKAGEWVLDSSRRLFVTGARKTETFTRFNGREYKAQSGTVLLLVSLRVRNAVPNKTMKIGLQGKVVSADGTSIASVFCDLPTDSAASLTAVLPSGAESKANLVFRVPKDFIPEKIQVGLSSVGQLKVDKKTHEVLLSNCDLAATINEQFDVSKAPKPTTPGGANQQNGDVQGKAGEWVSDGARRVFVTGIRRLDAFTRNNNKGQIKTLNKNQKLYVVTVLVQNKAKAKVRIGMGYIASNLAGMDGDAIGDAQVDFPNGPHASALSGLLAVDEIMPVTLVWRGSATFRPKAVMLHLSSIGSGVKSSPRIVRISLDNCDLEATAPQFTP